MSEGNLELNEASLHVIEELGAHMPGGFFIYRAEAPEELIYANRACFEIFGCADLEQFRALTGCTFRGLVYPEDYAAISASIVQQIGAHEDKLDHVEYRIVRRDGAIRWVDDYGHYAESVRYGGIYFVFISDITEQRLLQEQDNAVRYAVIEALSESYHTLWLIHDVETERFSLYRGDTVAGSVHAAPIRAAMAEQRYSRAMEAYIQTVVAECDRARLRQELALPALVERLREQPQFNTNYLRKLDDGSERYFRVEYALVHMPDGKLGMVCGFKDVDADVRRGQAMQKALREAEEVIANAKNDFLTNMSHDIRTPMNAIVGYTNIAKEHIHDPETLRDTLEKIASSSHFLLSMINDILDISKIEKGEMRLNLAPCDLTAVFRRIEDITSLQARRKKLEIGYHRESVRHFRVLADELRLEQVLINIIGNAIKYTPEGKEVDLYAQELGPGEPGKLRYRFVIRDTGIGISEDYLPHIFDSFTRGQRTTVNRVQGSGLGLAITAKIVELMGGAISVRSELGVGSEFTVDLELETLEEASPAPEEAGCSEADLAGKRVLIVEDNDMNAEIAAMILEQFDILSERAENGKLGVDLLRASPPGHFDGVLMDIQMPVMNGYEATRAIRGFDRQIPIIAVSANSYPEDVQESLNSGMNAHLAKPYEPEALLKLLQTYLCPQRGRREA